jgi:hypothetical protein
MAKITYKPLVYPAKIIIAWAEAIGGNNKIRDWLGKNGYPELYTFIFALHLEDNAREWLMKKNYPHLIALIEATEGNRKAQDWLIKNKFAILWHIAIAADGDKDSLIWLQQNEKDFAYVALKIKRVKDEIQTNNEDPHRIN